MPAAPHSADDARVHRCRTAATPNPAANSSQTSAWAYSSTGPRQPSADASEPSPRIRNTIAIISAAVAPSAKPTRVRLGATSLMPGSMPSKGCPRRRAGGPSQVGGTFIAQGAVRVRKPEQPLTSGDGTPCIGRPGPGLRIAEAGCHVLAGEPALEGVVALVGIAVAGRVAAESDGHLHHLVLGVGRQGQVAVPGGPTQGRSAEAVRLQLVGLSAVEQRNLDTVVDEPGLDGVAGLVGDDHVDHGSAEVQVLVEELQVPGEEAGPLGRVAAEEGVPGVVLAVPAIRERAGVR